MNRPSRRPGPPEEVFFPVVPMLDMAFQLLAFFVLTFQAPTRETRLDLYLPAAPVALPEAGRGPARGAVGADAQDVENDLVIRAEADDDGSLKSLRLGEATISGARLLEARLRTYEQFLEDQPLRVVLIADDALRYEEAVRLVGACSAAGVQSIRLAVPAGPGRSP